VGARRRRILIAPARAAAVALAALALCGCFNIGVVTGTEIPADRVSQIVPGKTTKDEVLRWFGAPYEATDGEVLARMFDAGEIAAEDLVALPFNDMLAFEILEGDAKILMTIVFNWARVDVKRDRLVVFFDEHDRVLYYGVTRQRGAEPTTAEAAESERRREDPVIQRMRRRR
jgi:hypothetical protein